MRRLNFIVASIFFVVTLFTVFVSANILDVSLTSPDNNAWTTDSTPDFVFNATSTNSSNFNCTAWVNNTAYGTNNSVNNSTSTTITASSINDGIGYSWLISCNDTWNSGNETNSSTRTLNIDSNAPNVASLDAPGNGTTIGSVPVDFNFTATDNLGLKNCSLWGNFSGSWAENDSITAPSNNTETNITINSLSDGTYIWNVLCYDNASNSDWYTNNYTVTLETTDPTVTLNVPANTYNSSSTTVTFSLKCSDNIGVDYLQLWGTFGGSWAANQTNSSPINDSYWSVSLTLAEGSYTWAGYCNDTGSNDDWSANRTVTVDTTDPNSVNLTLSDDSIEEGDRIDVECASSDSVGIKNISVTSDENSGVTICEENDDDCSNTYKPGDSGTFTITCITYDYAGNSNNNSDTLQVNSVSGGGGGGVPAVPTIKPHCGDGNCDSNENYLNCPEDCMAPSEAPAIIIHNLGILADYEGNSTETRIKSNETISFVVKGNSYTVQVNRIMNYSSTIWIWPGPSSHTLYLNEMTQFDLDNNNANELEITLKDVNNSTAIFMFKEIEEVFPEEEIPAKPFWKKWWFWVIVVVVVIAIATALYYYFFKPKPKRKRYLKKFK